MIKIWKYTLVGFGLMLVLLAGTGVSANSFEPVNIPGHVTDSQVPDSSSGCFNIHNDACEDEQIHQCSTVYLFIESFIIISSPRISDLIFKPCSIPWEPPKK